MARPTRKLIDALREAAARLEGGASYQWGHMGACNCGHLVQTLTALPRAEIHAMAMARAGDWGQQAVDFCPTSGYPLDHVIATLLDAGMSLDDIDHLERLSDLSVLRSLPLGQRDLVHNRREDAVTYMRAWADLLEGALPAPPPTPLPVRAEAPAPSPSRSAAPDEAAA